MANFRLLGGLFLLAVAGSISCSKNTLTLPEPAQSIAGTYRARLTSSSFPIKGDSLTLTIKAVSEQTIDVVIRANQNTKSGDSLAYKQAMVSQSLDRTDLNKGCVSYRALLTPDNNSNVLIMTCAEENVIQYLYTPVGQKTILTVKFKKV